MKADVIQSITRIELEFHRRAFGEELARVNFLPLAQRRAYAARLRLRARQKLQAATSDQRTAHRDAAIRGSPLAVRRLI